MDDRPRRAPAVLVAALSVAFLAATILRARGVAFDDAYITCRYAKNLATGHGLAWNPGQAPVEGYTNFLLVVALAPCIRAGLDPLACVRVASAVAAAVVAWLVARDVVGDRRDPWTALFCAGIFLLAGTTARVCTLGLETVLYAAALYGCFRLALRAADAESNRDSIRMSAAFGAATAIASLLRPEAPLLAAAWAIAAFRERGRGAWPRVAAAAAAAVAVLAPYAAWKLAYFGDVVPNSARVKMGDVGLWSSAGIGSIVNAFAAWSAVVVAAALSLGAPTVDPSPRGRRARAIALAFVVVCLAFVARVDTLMDVASRFLYPASAFLFLLAGPALVAAYRAISRTPAAVASALALLLACAFADGGPGAILRETGGALRRERSPGITSLMQREDVAARALATFPGVDRISIAFCDAGAIPYFTGATFIDTGGLNDAAVATARTTADAARSVFARKPTLLLLAMDADGAPSRRPPGRLGDGPSWIGDPAWPWSEYRYAGALRDPTYDVVFLLRRDYERADEFADFLRRRVVDDVERPPAFAR